MIVTRRPKKRSVREALATLAELRQAEEDPADAVALIREGRDELDHRISRR